jgi:hypothetical protein
MALSSRALSAGKAVIMLSLEGDGKVQKGLKTLQAKVGNIGATMSRIGTIGAAAFAGLAAPLAGAIKLASDAAESLNKFNAVFADQRVEAGKWADDLAKNIGRSKSEIQNTMSAFQAFFVGLGFGSKEALEMSKQMQSLAIDFASFHNLSDAEAAQRFISALSGSSEVLDMYGINIKVAALEQEALAKGIKKSWTEMTEAEKTTLRLSVIMKSMTSQGAVGDAVKTAGSFANRMKALRARINDTAVEIGTVLLPVATEWLGKVQEIASAVAKWVSQNHQMVLELAATIAKVGAASIAIFALGKAIQFTAVTVGALRTAITLLSAHPLVALLTVVGAVIVAFAHWMGWLDKVYAWFGKMSGLIPQTTGEIKDMAGALNEVAEAHRNELKARIEANRATHGNPWGIDPNKPHTPPVTGSDDGMFATFGADEANRNALAAAQRAWKAVKDFAADVDNDLQNAFGNAILGPQKAARFRLAVNGGMQSAQSVANQTAVFDTRLARQMFGAGTDEELAELRKHTKLLGNINKKRGGMSVV